MTLAEAVWKDPERMGGRLCFRGTRLPVAMLFEHIATGHLDEFRSGWDYIPEAAIQAVLMAAPELLERSIGPERAIAA